MKYSITSTTLLLPVAFLVLLAACNDRQGRSDVDSAAGKPAADSAAAPDAMAPDATDPALAAGAGATAAGSPRERAALGVLNAINDHEIAAGRQALAKGVEGDVAAFAQMMIDQHSENRDKTSSFNPDSSATDAVAQKEKGKAELAALGDKSGTEYASAYVDAMVKGHTEALDALDTKLIPSAESTAVRDHLTQTREHVARHLEQAKALASPASAPPVR